MQLIRVYAVEPDLYLYIDEFLMNENIGIHNFLVKFSQLQIILCMNQYINVSVMDLLDMLQTHVTQNLISLLPQLISVFQETFCLTLLKELLDRDYEK